MMGSSGRVAYDESSRSHSPTQRQSTHAKKSKKTRVFVLGGGPAALSAVFGLTSSPGWRDRFEITLLQMGWRLGGKCASSRDPNHGYRNYEHGFHILGGFYHNSLRLLRDCYAEWKSPPNGKPFPDCALTPHNLVHLMQRRGGRWEHVCVPFPDRNGQFGEGEIALTPYEMTRAVWDWIKRAVSDSSNDTQALHPELHTHVAALDEIFPQQDPLHLKHIDVGALDRHVKAVHHHIRSAGQLLARPGSISAEFDYPMMLRIALIFMRGIIADGIWMRGFDCINDKEFSDWLREHGAGDDVIQSPYIQGGYDYAFAYHGGDSKNRRFAAGSGLRGTLRLILTYHRSVFAHMNGGMGEVVVTPLYDVLKERGVKFRFFNRVDHLELDDKGKTISRIRVTRQAKPLDGEDNYDPLMSYDVAGETRRFWPPHPKYEGLSDTLKEETEHAEDVYESPWWPGGEQIDLEFKNDFDVVVLGISAGALPYICKDLAERRPRWKQMLENLETVQTIAAQLWLSEETEALGWSGGPTALTAFAQPYATWADMSFLLQYEKNEAAPCAQLSYFCGTMPRLKVDQDTHYPPLERQRVQKAADEWIADNLRQLWPNIAQGPDGSFKPITAKYVRANSLPAGAYVLTPPGTVETRLKPHQSGITNLFLAGDWTRNGADTGSFENAVMSGLQCSRAICGYPRRIFGESDFA
ncbi:MAG: NAD(P)-binding protein [Alphaproteobacteria bacterium]|nr:NAD(P)-binding protein [Alphaproteobacteria bacterium]